MEAMYQPVKWENGYPMDRAKSGESRISWGQQPYTPSAWAPCGLDLRSTLLTKPTTPRRACGNITEFVLPPLTGIVIRTSQIYG